MTKYAGLLCVALALLPFNALAEFVGVPREEFQRHYRPQKDPLWCWASSAEMVLAYEGVNLPQEIIVQRLKGAMVSKPGNPFEMLAATNGVFEDINHRRAVVSGQYVVGAPLPTVLYNQLRHKRPVILTYQGGSIGHAVVLTGIDADVTASGVFVRRMYVFDPFIYRMVPGRRGAAEFEQDAYKDYAPQQTPAGIAIPAGMITGMILVDGTPL